MQDAKAALETHAQGSCCTTKIGKRISLRNDTPKYNKLKSFADFAKLDSNQQHEIIAPFEQVIKEIEIERYIGNIRTKLYNATTDLYQKQLESMMRWANPPKVIEPGDTEPEKTKIVFVRKDNVKINFPKPSLETKQDVEDYLAALKEQYLRIIDENKRISL
jgi:hypothetical protein